MVNKEAFKGILKGLVYNGEQIRNSEVNDLLERWGEKKSHIAQLFGGKLKIEREIDMKVGLHEAAAIREELIEKLSRPKLIFAISFLFLISIDEFRENSLETDKELFGVKLSKGMKVSKALAKFCQKEDKEEVLIAHSMSNQEMFTKGKVVLSIDPIDFITMSSNNSGWRSCHRMDGGEYSTGPLSYLTDSSSIICYVQSKKPSKIGGYEFSNKTWRQIALISEDLTFSLQERQYPATNKVNEDAVSSMLVELFNKENEVSGYGFSKVGVEDLGRMHKDYSYHEQTPDYYYNDILAEAFKEGNVVYDKGRIKNPSELIKSKNKPVKGSMVYCLDCGEQLEGADCVFCEDCCD